MENAPALACCVLLAAIATTLLYLATLNVQSAVTSTDAARAVDVLIVNEVSVGRSSPTVAGIPKIGRDAVGGSPATHPRGKSAQTSSAAGYGTGISGQLGSLQSNAIRTAVIFWSEAVVLYTAAFGMYALAVITALRLTTDTKRRLDHITTTNRLWSLVQNLPAGVVLVEGERFYMNSIAERITGYRTGEIPTLSIWFKLLYGDAATTVETHYRNDRQKGFPESARVTITAKGGSLRQVEFAACGNRHGEIWVLRDITEECAANEKFRVLFEHSSDAHLLFDNTGLIDCNNAALRMIKVSDKAELIGRHPGTFSPEFQNDGRPSCDKAVEYDQLARESGHARFEWLRLASDGEIFPVEVSLTLVPLNGQLVLLDVWHDLREQKKAEAMLIRSEMAMQEAQALAHIGNMEYYLQTGTSFWSAEACRLFNVTADNVPQTFEDLVSLVKDGMSSDLQTALKSLTLSGEDTSVEVVVGAPSKEPRYLKLLLRCEFEEIGNPLRVIITSIDVTDRHHYEESLKSAIGVAAVANAQLETEIMLVNNQAVELEYQKQELEAANQRLHDLASKDGLTGLYNHRTFQERLRIELDNAMRAKLPVSLILLDVDNFKRFNDQFGHPAGDEVLRRVAAMVLSTCRPGDTAARYGGEEFAVVLPQSTIEEAVAIAEQIRRFVEANDRGAAPVTVSLGVTCSQSPLVPAEQLIGEADVALYQSKHTGRNQVSAFRSGSQEASEIRRAA